MPPLVIASRRGNSPLSFLFLARQLSLALLLLGLMLTSASAAERVIFHPGWLASPQFAGIFVALDQGFYREAGLAVEIEPFAYGLNSPAKIDAQPDVCAVGSIEGYILLQKRGQGAHLKALAAMLQESPAGYMSLASAKIGSVQDFRGRRVGVHKFADKLYGWFIKKAGLSPADAHMIFVEDDVTLLTRGELDVMQGYASGEFVRLQELTGGTARFTSFASLGFPSYSEILYTTAEQTVRHADALHRFIEATRRGWIYAFAHPDEAVAAVSARSAASGDLPHLRKALIALQPFVCPEGRAPLAPMDPVKWRTVQKVGVEIGLMSEAEPVENFLLNW